MEDPVTGFPQGLHMSLAFMRCNHTDNDVAKMRQVLSCSMSPVIGYQITRITVINFLLIPLRKKNSRALHHFYQLMLKLVNIRRP
jgi:hypothetical protein